MSMISVRTEYLRAGCISKWHGIEKGRALGEAEVDFIMVSIMGWIERQIRE
jgi:hypothetical protein